MNKLIYSLDDLRASKYGGNYSFKPICRNIPILIKKKKEYCISM